MAHGWRGASDRSIRSPALRLRARATAFRVARRASSGIYLRQPFALERLARRRETIDPLALLADARGPLRAGSPSRRAAAQKKCVRAAATRRKDQSRTYVLRGAAERWLPASAARTTLKLASRFSAAPSPALRLSSPWQLARVGNACAPSPARGHRRAATGRRRAAQSYRAAASKARQSARL